MPSQTYPYKPLSWNPPEIRMVQIQPSTDGEAPIECKLVTRKLIPDQVELPADTSAGGREALSYTWGTSREPCSIILDGHKFAVTQNLLAFLRQRREGEKAVEIWIDAICINQSDKKEKDTQIPKMRLIYGMSVKLTIWLGPAHDNSKRAMKCLLELGSGSPYWKMPILSQATLTALQKLLSRAWWRRVWIIQEVIAGGWHLKMPSAEVMCGNQTVPWMRIVLAAARMRAYQEDHRQYFPNIDNILELDALRESSLGTRLVGILHMNVSEFSTTAMLARCRPFDASDARDKIYATACLADNDYLTGTLEPDYGAPVEEIYTSLAVKEYTRGDLAFLRHCGQSARNMPSWVPDWSIDTGMTALPARLNGAMKDVPWWATPPEEHAPVYSSMLLQENSTYAEGHGVPGYTFQGYSFHGHPFFKEQADGERIMRLAKLRLEAGGHTVRSSPPDAEGSQLAAWEEPVLKAELAAKGTLQGLKVKNFWITAEPACQPPTTKAAVMRMGERLTECTQKRRIHETLAEAGPGWRTASSQMPQLRMNAQMGVMEAFGVLWDNVDAAAEAAFPSDLGSEWHNASKFMVLVGQSKAMAMNHAAVARRYGSLKDRMMAFWATLFIGRGRSESGQFVDIDGVAREPEDWLPVLESGWSPASPRLTPLTRGLMHIHHINNVYENVYRDLLEHDLNVYCKLHHDWGRAVDNDEPQTSTDIHDDVSPTFYPEKWTSEDSAHWQNEFDWTGRMWSSQPYDLYHRPFRLLNVVPDPYHKYRQVHDGLARRKLQTRQRQIMTEVADGLPSDAHRHAAKRLSGSFQAAFESSVPPDPIGTMNVGFEKYALGRRFFVTKRGYCGIGPREVRAGDVVAVVFGLDVPLVLRRTGEGIGERTVIGESYVQDIMRGEVLEAWRMGSVEGRYIRLR